MDKINWYTDILYVYMIYEWLGKPGSGGAQSCVKTNESMNQETRLKFYQNIIIET